MSIDLGSSGVRACIWRPDAKKGQDPVIMLLNRENGGDGYTFSAHGDVMDYDVPDDKIYIDNLEREGRLGTPLKYGLYILADAPTALQKEYHLIKDLLDEDRRNKEEFRRRLRLGLMQMLIKLNAKVKELITGLRKNWNVGKLGITIPAQWELEFEEEYRSILAEVFEWNPYEDRDRISFIFEPEGLAAYLLHSKEYRDEAIAQSGPNEHRMVLFLDFGGHSMVSKLQTCSYLATE